MPLKTIFARSACSFKVLKTEHVHTVQSDIIYHDGVITAFISLHQWPRNPGNIIVVPNEHFENIYDLPPHYGSDIQRVARLVALALKAVYACDGVSTRQHNEPAGNQDVWHYHVHVTPRYQDDQFYGTQPELMTVGKEPATPRGSERTWSGRKHRSLLDEHPEHERVQDLTIDSAQAALSAPVRRLQAELCSSIKR